MRAPGWAVSAAYVGAVATLAAITFSDPGRTLTWAPEGILLLVTLPALIPCLPAVYLGGAAAWNLSAADNGGPIWPVALSYTTAFTLIAMANVWLTVRAFGHLRRRAQVTPAGN